MFCGDLGLANSNSSVNWNGFIQFMNVLFVPVNKDTCSAQCLAPCQEFKYTTSVSTTPWPHVSTQASVYYSYIFDKPRFGDKFNEYYKLGDLSLSNSSAAQDLLRKLDNEGLIRDNFFQLNIRFDLRPTTCRRMLQRFHWTHWEPKSVCLSLWLGVTIIFIFELCEFVYNLIMIKLSN